MRRIFIFLSVMLSVMLIIVLSAYGTKNYDKAIDEVISQHTKSLQEEGLDSEEFIRDNAIIRVYDDGKYIQFAFYMKNHFRELSTFNYYEKLGDSYEEMSHMPGSGEGDRLGLDMKKPDYES